MVTADDLRPGLHLNMLGADGPGKSEAEIGGRCRAASSSATSGIRPAMAASSRGPSTPAWWRASLSPSWETCSRAAAPGRSSPEAVTLFDSTGLAIQDVAICLAVLEAHRAGVASPGVVRL